MTNIIMRGCVCAFTQAPNDLIVSSISSDAVRIWLYIQMRFGCGDWGLKSWDVRKKLGFTEYAWKKATRELIDDGWMIRERTHSESGEWQWIYTLTIGRLTTDGATDGGGTNGGQTTDKERKSLDTKSKETERESTDQEPCNELQDDPRPIATGTPRSAVGLQLERLVSLSNEQDRIDVSCMIDEHGYDKVRETAIEVKGTDHRPPSPSLISKKLDGFRYDRQSALKKLAQWLRKRYDIESHCSNDTLMDVIENYRGVTHVLKSLHDQHGYIQAETIEVCIEDGTFRHSDPRDDTWIKKQLALCRKE